MQVEDFSSLVNLPIEKLLKLRDVAKDHFIEVERERIDAWDRLQDILAAIEERTGGSDV